MVGKQCLNHLPWVGWSGGVRIGVYNVSYKEFIGVESNWVKGIFGTGNGVVAGVGN